MIWEELQSIKSNQRHFSKYIIDLQKSHTTLRNILQDVNLSMIQIKNNTSILSQYGMVNGHHNGVGNGMYRGYDTRNGRLSVSTNNNLASNRSSMVSKSGKSILSYLDKHRGSLNPQQAIASSPDTLSINTSGHGASTHNIINENYETDDDINNTPATLVLHDTNSMIIHGIDGIMNGDETDADDHTLGAQTPNTTITYNTVIDKSGHRASMRSGTHNSKSTGHGRQSRSEKPSTINTLTSTISSLERNVTDNNKRRSQSKSGTGNTGGSDGCEFMDDSAIQAMHDMFRIKMNSKKRDSSFSNHNQNPFITVKHAQQQQAQNHMAGYGMALSPAVTPLSDAFTTNIDQFMLLLKSHEREKEKLEKEKQDFENKVKKLQQQIDAFNMSKHRASSISTNMSKSNKSKISASTPSTIPSMIIFLFSVFNLF